MALGPSSPGETRLARGAAELGALYIFMGNNSRIEGKGVNKIGVIHELRIEVGLDHITGKLQAGDVRTTRWRSEMKPGRVDTKTTETRCKKRNNGKLTRSGAGNALAPKSDRIGSENKGTNFAIAVSEGPLCRLLDVGCGMCGREWPRVLDPPISPLRRHSSEKPRF